MDFDQLQTNLSIQVLQSYRAVSLLTGEWEAGRPRARTPALRAQLGVETAVGVYRRQIQRAAHETRWKQPKYSTDWATFVHACCWRASHSSRRFTK